MEYQDCLEVFWQKLCGLSKDNCGSKVLELYHTKGFLTVNFAYFAVLVKWNIIDGACNEFWKYFLSADLILPDGIALRLRAKKKKWMSLENMNWDDFLRWFFGRLDGLEKNYVVVGYWGKNDELLIEKTKQEFTKVSKKWFDKFFHGYGELPWEQLNYLKSYKWLKILLQSRGGHQEEWTVKNLDKLRDFGFLVFNVWGLFDHRSGVEPRAPKVLQKFKLEWLRRLILNPQKNWVKVKDSFRVFKEILR